MNIKKLSEELKQDEGVKYEIYLDHLGLPTFGIGHLIVPEDPEYGKPVGTKITENRVMTAFTEDVKKAVYGCRSVYGEKFDLWPEEVQQILINMCFNLGPTGLSKFKKFREALERHQWSKAAVEGRDSRWYKQVPNRAERLMKRLEALEKNS
jgi:lysozyme